jgi:hypothetical protein
MLRYGNPSMVIKATIYPPQLLIALYFPQFTPPGRGSVLNSKMHCAAFIIYSKAL